jgi:protein SCO1
MTGRLLPLLRLGALIVALTSGAPASAGLTAQQLANVGVSPPPGAKLPLDAELADLDGLTIPLGKAIAGRPTVVIFVDYACPQLCSPILGVAGAALNKSGLEPGRDYRLVVIGFNPQATNADARRMVDGQIGLTSRLGLATEALGASEAAAARLTGAVGFRYAFDPALRRFAHPAALFVVTADGRLSRTLAGLAVTSDDLRLALVGAGDGAIGTVSDQVRLLCYGFDASAGFYADRVRIGLAAAGVATLVAVGVSLVTLGRLSMRTPA